MIRARSSNLWGQITVVAVGICCFCFAQSAFTGSIIGWGSMAVDSNRLDTKDFIAIAAGWRHNLASKSDGSIVGWGNDNYGQATPADGNDFVAIAAGQRLQGGYSHGIIPT